MLLQRRRASSWPALFSLIALLHLAFFASAQQDDVTSSLPPSPATASAPAPTRAVLTLAPYALQSPSTSSRAPAVASSPVRPTASPTPLPLPPSPQPSISYQPTSKAQLETLTWASLRATVLASVVFMILLVGIFESGRRSKVLGEVFDRKRETRPDRVPPPLIASATPGSWFGWVWFICEYFYVDAYVYPEYAAYAKRIQEEKEKNERGDAEGEQSAPTIRSSVYWPSIVLPWGTSQANDEGNVVETGAESKFSDEEKNAEPETEGDDGQGGTSAVLVSGGKTLATGTIPKEPAEDVTAEKEKAETATVDEVKSSALTVDTDSQKPQLSPKAPSRWHYLFVRAGCSIGSLYSYRKRKRGGPRSPRHFKKLSGGDWHRASAAAAQGDSTGTSSKGVGKDLTLLEQLQRFLPVINPLPPTATDRELLRCIGLDCYTIIRFLRLGFEVTFWPFVVACVVLIPTYYTNNYDGSFEQVDDPEQSVGGGGTGFSPYTTTGYFSITINKLENRNNKLVVVWFYAIAYYLVVLRRMWVEWVIFCELREDFLANGDPSAIKEDDAESLKQFRNTCIVENIPASHRRDKDIFIFYNTLFPNQVRRAEIIVNSSRLSALIQERQNYIEQYESVYAKQIHQEREYERMMQLFNEGAANRVGCKHRKPVEPTELRFNVGGGTCGSGGQKMSSDAALAHYMAEIRRTNALVDDEYDALVKRKKENERTPSALEIAKSEISEGKHKDQESVIRQLECIFANDGESDDDDTNDALEAIVDCSNGFVEFETRAAKQCALQVELSGQASYFSTKQAPDPRDLIWRNMTANRKTISRSHFVVQIILFIGILFWSALVGLIGSVESAVNEWAEQNDVQVKFLTGFIAGYLPVLLLMILMAIIPSIFTLLAMQVIRFRTRSEADKFVLKWNLLYRIANFMVILISGTLYKTLLDVRDNPEMVVESIVEGILSQSQFFFNLTISTIGTGTSFNLSQLWAVLYWLVVKGVVTEEAMSERKLERQRVPADYIFGRFCAEHIYILMISMVYSAIVPIVMGACSVYFFVASKIYTYQCLYVFSQKYEGGGKVFYSINRVVFVVIYASIVIFATVMLLKEMFVLAGIFLFGMVTITYMVDTEIKRRFSKTSRKLPLTRARIIDEEYENLVENEEQIVVEPSTRYIIEPGSPRLDMPSSFAGTGRRKLLTKQATAARQYNASVGMGIGLPGLGGDEEDVEKLDHYLYRQPDLHEQTWELEPRPYRLNE